MTMCSQLLTIKHYTLASYVLVKHSIDSSKAATETTLAGLKQPFFFVCFFAVFEL